MTRDPTKRPHRKARRLVVGTETWWWLFAGRGAILWNPNGRRHDIRLETLNGLTLELHGRAVWKKWGGDDWALKPRDIRAFIDRLNDPGEPVQKS